MARHSGPTRTSNCPSMCHGTSPCLLEYPPALDRVCSQLPRQLRYRYVTIYGLSGIPNSPLPCPGGGSLSSFCTGELPWITLLSKIYTKRIATRPQLLTTSLDKRFGFPSVISPCRWNQVTRLLIILNHLKLRKLSIHLLSNSSSQRLWKSILRSTSLCSSLSLQAILPVYLPVCSPVSPPALTTRVWSSPAWTLLFTINLKISNNKLTKMVSVSASAFGS